jgi:enoyl-CoA hydratase/carnithine racemase
MTTVLQVERHGAVEVLTMHRPEKRNALDNALTEALVNGLRAADRDEQVACVVLTGAGPAFCAGADMSEFKTLTPENRHLVDQRAALTMSLHRSFSQMSKPVVTAINGPAMGGGAGLALAGDIAVMAASAKIGYPEVQHGIVAAIVMPNLVRQIGRKAAFELLAIGKPVDAARALALGMVNRVVPDAELMDEAMRFARDLAAASQPAMAATKQLFYRVVDLPFDEALAAGREVNKRMRGFGKA